MIEFEVDGIPFELKRLDIDTHCAGLELLGRALGPTAASAIALARGGGDDALDYAALLPTLLASAGTVPALLRTFQDVARVSRHTDGRFAPGGVMMPLKPWLADVFTGRVDRMLAFLVHAVKAEYGYFLATLQNGGLAALLAAAKR